MPPKLSLSGKTHPAHTAWHEPPQGRDYSERGGLAIDSPIQQSGSWHRPGPMEVQQQQQERQPQQQRLLQQRGGVSTSESHTPYKDGNTHFA